MEPFQTFMDDPLRVLRLVRFASRLEFTIGSGARKVMSDPRVLDALALKISRERVEAEVPKMLKGELGEVQYFRPLRCLIIRMEQGRAPGMPCN